MLRPGGLFALSDIVTGENAEIPMVEAAFARLGASAGATISHYQIVQSISRWQAALAGGHISWACFVARKPAPAV